MIVSKGYYIEQVVQDNKIVIGLPQTVHTFKNSLAPVSDRRLALTDTELAALLQIVMLWCEAEELK